MAMTGKLRVLLVRAGERTAGGGTNRGITAFEGANQPQDGWACIHY